MKLIVAKGLSLIRLSKSKVTFCSCFCRFSTFQCAKPVLKLLNLDSKILQYLEGQLWQYCFSI